MGRVRQKIKTGKYQVTIINMEAQGKLIVSVIDMKGKLLGQIRISGDSGWFENRNIDLSLNLN